MKSRHILAGASLLHAVRAIPAYITTVFQCPDAVTITQTVYPPGWTNTGPIYTTRQLGGSRPERPSANPQQPAANTPRPGCTEVGLTTSWETEYATRTVVYSEYGMYSGPPGCPSEIIAYMPTTITCSEPQTTGWVGYAADISCASCTATTLVGLRPSVATNNGVVGTYYTIWTEVYVEAGATTRASAVGNHWTTTATQAPYVYPYPKQCTNTYGGAGGAPTPGYTAGGGAAVPTPGYTRGGGGYPSIDYNNPNVFRGGSSIPIYSAGGAPSARPTPTPGYTPARGGGYPTIDYNDPNVFRGGDYTGAAPTYRATPASPTYGPNTGTYGPRTSPSGPGTPRPSGGRPTVYPGDYADPNVFRPLSGTVGIVSYTGPQPTPTATGPGYSVRPSYYSNFASIDPAASENFRPLSGTVGIVSLNPPQSFPPPISTVVPVITRATSAYPSIDYSNPTVFAAADPNPAASAGGSVPAASSSAPASTGR
ncbi:hypothetical protein DRE_03517 [Drechslerella stenobrocha 248]|uniref:Uncharacterized protein n=1 Tax=Drechslerella stenobrocha 248 TaxID=1043628 RepID=W7I4R0_9PEZI|nr:hypothetical protein DRE_03517 [Drechslerella stenobrocha 248]